VGGLTGNSADLDRHAGDLATHQHGVIARRQLLEMGFSARMVERRVARGWLRSLYRGVYALGHEKLSMRGRWMAAVLACGDGAMLSHGSAAALWGLIRPRGPIEIVTRNYRQSPGLRVHRSRVHPEDRDEIDAIPICSIARTLLDLAGIWDEGRVERTWEEADRLGLLELRAMEQICTRAQGRRGSGVIRRLIVVAREPVRTRSHLEDRFAVFCRERGLPAPAFNCVVLDREVDALWPRERLIVEMDGFAFHSHRAAFERDRVRDAALQVAGYRVLHLTWLRLEKEPTQIAGEIRSLLKRGRP
jgi:very-short-patch-repair endonuclease